MKAPSAVQRRVMCQTAVLCERAVSSVIRLPAVSLSSPLPRPLWWTRWKCRGGLGAAELSSRLPQGKQKWVRHLFLALIYSSLFNCLPTTAPTARTGSGNELLCSYEHWLSFPRPFFRAAGELNGSLTCGNREGGICNLLAFLSFY